MYVYTHTHTHIYRYVYKAYPEGGHEAEEIDPEEGGRHVVVTVQRSRTG